MKDIDPLDIIAAIMPGGIELQEAVGQQNLVASSQLPVDGLEWHKYEVGPQQYLESLGFEFGEVDDIFVNVKIPEGWKLEASDHSMWSYLFDPNGRTRASIFYKAAFYDRSAHWNLDCRFNYGELYEDDEGFVENTIISRVLDGKKVLYQTKPRKYTKKHSTEFWNMQDSAGGECIDWLKDNYPDYENPMEYWDGQ